MIKLSAAGPEDATRNGLDQLLEDAVHDPTTPHVIIATVNTKKMTVDTDTGDTVPTLRLLHVEVVGPDFADQAHTMLTATYSQRTGIAELPFSVDQEVRLALGQQLDKDGTITPIKPPRRRRR